MSKYWSPPRAQIELGLNGLRIDRLSEDTIAASCLEPAGGPGKSGRPVAQPIVHTSTYRMRSVKEFQDVFMKGGYMYQRWSNPTCEAAETAVKLLEGAAGSLTFSCGMAAISTALLTFLNTGDHVITCNPVYGGTHDLINTLPSYGIEITYIDGYEIEKYRAAVKPNTKVLYGETPCNPLMMVTDLEGFAKLGKELGLITMVDTTFASPYLVKPIKYGVDIVIHSATKYLGGHSDLIAGVVSTRTEEQWNQLLVKRRILGTVLSPHDAYLLLRGLKTLPLRVSRQSTSGLQIAEWLESQEGVKNVHYPGLAGHADYEIAKKQMKMFGGMISFEIEGGLSAATTFVESVHLFALAVSLGGTESLIEHPASMTHATISPEERRLTHISDDLVRISVGLEDPEDLMADLKQALVKSQAATATNTATIKSTAATITATLAATKAAATAATV